MPRDHGRIRLDIWGDDDWRDLPSLSQWLYFQLITSPALNFCGVADWRPARVAALTAELQASDVEYAASWLEAGEFVLIDRSTEESLVRSFIKHDGLLKSPNVTKAMVKDHAAIGSGILRAVVVDQLKRLREANPELHWKETGTLLRKRSLTIVEAFAELSPNPSVNPSGNPSADRAPLLAPNSVLLSPCSKPKTPSVSAASSVVVGLESETSR